MRSPILFSALLAVPTGLCAVTSSLAQERPITGQAVAKYEPLDRAVQSAMDKLNATAATVAVSEKGKLLYSRGYGWSDAAKKTPTPPDVLMRIASVSKPITAAEVHKLIRDGKLTPDTKVFPLLGIKPYNGKEGDGRLGSITVQHLLDHKGGWDRDKSFDPMFRMPEIEKALDLKKPATPVNVIEYMLAEPLQFAPGTREAYSNFGYCVLGRVVEHVTGKAYAAAVHDDILRQLGIRDIKLGRNAPKNRDPHEVWYVEGDQSFSVEVMDAHGGWIASAPSLCKFLDAYWITGEPRKAGNATLTFFGSLPGTSSMVYQRPDGLNVAVLFNNRTGADLNPLLDTIDKALPSLLQNRYAAVWEKRDDGKWAYQYGLGAADYQKEMDKQVKAGFRLTCVSGHEFEGEARYAAVWEKRKGPEWVAHHGLNATDFQKAFDKLAGEGYRPVWVNGYTVRNTDLYAAIWEKRDGPAWAARHGLNAASYQKAFDKFAAEGYRPTCVCGYGSKGEDRYAAIWEKRDGPDSEARHGLNAADYQKTFDKLAGDGFRLVCVSGYSVGGEDRYAAIWEKRDGPDWEARHLLGPAAFQKETDKLTRDGFRFTCVSGYTIGK